MSQVDRKINFIKAWYNDECSKLDFGNRLKLARMWIYICLKDEEYEMAAVIKEERQKIIQKHIKEKRGKRSLSQKFIIALYLLRRKILIWFKNKR